jgi:hypothetical protein
MKTARIRDEFLLDRDIVFLKHGSFGTCPRDDAGVDRGGRSGSVVTFLHPI